MVWRGWTRLGGPQRCLKVREQNLTFDVLITPAACCGGETRLLAGRITWQGIGEGGCVGSSNASPGGHIGNAYY